MSIKEIYNIVKKLRKTKKYVIITDEEIITNTDVEEQPEIRNRLSEYVISNMTPELYGAKLEQYDPDLFNAYKESDYQITRADYLEAQLNYVNAINNPNGEDGNKLFAMYKQLTQLKQKFENFK